MYGQGTIFDGSWVSSDDQPDYEPVDIIPSLNTSARALGFSLVKFIKVNQRDMPSYATRNYDISL